MTRIETSKAGLPVKEQPGFACFWGRASHPLEYATLPGRTMDVPIDSIDSFGEVGSLGATKRR
jgi:hypothetical protein